MWSVHLDATDVLVSCHERRAATPLTVLGALLRLGKLCSWPHGVTNAPAIPDTILVST